jgi:hypothetical protein
VYPAYGNFEISWQTARNKCNFQKGDLATDVLLNSSNPQKFAQLLSLKNGIKYWIGLQKDPWIWTDGNGNFRTIIYDSINQPYISYICVVLCITSSMRHLHCLQACYDIIMALI